MDVQPKECSVAELETPTLKVTFCNAGRAALDKTGSKARRRSVVRVDDPDGKSRNLTSRMLAVRTCDKNCGIQYLS